MPHLGENTLRLQAYLFGATLKLRPLTQDHFEALYQAAADPLIWEQHPDRERYKKEVFQKYFASGIASQGAFAIFKEDQLIGSSRYTMFNPETSSVEIGYTFLKREYWGQKINLELKCLMLNYAFRFVSTCYFVVGAQNLRSQKAMAKIGGKPISGVGATPVQTDFSKSVVFEITKSQWQDQNFLEPIFHQNSLETSRMALEPIEVDHAPEMCELFSDKELHKFVPFEALSLEDQVSRCSRWAKRRSPEGDEVWLNWAGRERESQKVIAHFQVGIKFDGTASIGYLVARNFQRQGFASEAISILFAYLNSELKLREVKLWTDTRNIASHQLAKKMGMICVDTLKEADFFKGATSDEFVFSKVF